MRALVVDDDAQVRELLERTAQGCGLDTTGCGSVREAVGLLDTDLVLLDIALPNGNGYQVLKELRQLRDDVPVVVVSAYPEWRDRVSKELLTWFVDKPFSLHTLRSVIIAAMEQANDLRTLHNGTKQIRDAVRRLSQ